MISLLRSRGSITRISYAGKTALRSSDLCAEHAGALSKDEQDRIQRAFRDAFPTSSVRLFNNSDDIPQGFYVFRAFEASFIRFVTDPANRHEAAVASGVGRGFSAARRKHGWRFTVTIQDHKVVVDSGDPDAIRLLLEGLSNEIAAKNAELAKYNSIAAKAARRALEIGEQLRNERNKKPRYRVLARGRQAA